MKTLCAAATVGWIVLARSLGGGVLAEDLPLIEKVDLQPLQVNTNRLLQALTVAGNPLSQEQVALVTQPPNPPGVASKIRIIQEALDPLCLAAITINPESRVSVKAGPAMPLLVENDWALFLLKVHNQAGVTAPLAVTSEAEEVEVALFVDKPMTDRLSGVSVDYRVLVLKAKQAGRLATVLSFDVGQGTQDLGFRSDLLVGRAGLPLPPAGVSGSWRKCAIGEGTLLDHGQSRTGVSAGFVPGECDRRTADGEGGARTVDRSLEARLVVG